MSINESINDVHVDAACALICAQWHRSLLVLKNQGVSASDAAILAAEGRVGGLKEIRVAPNDLVDRVDSYFQPQRDRLVSDVAKLELMVNDPVTASLFYPDSDGRLDIGGRLVTARQMLAALDAVWTPQAT